MDEITIWRDFENDRIFVKGYGRTVEVDPLIVLAYQQECKRVAEEKERYAFRCARYERMLKEIGMPV